MLFARARAHPQSLILLAEDFRPLRFALQKLLEFSHYRVLPAGTPAEALRAAASSSIPVDLLVARLNLPGMTGPELASQIRNRSNRFSVLYMSDDSLRWWDVVSAEEIRFSLLPDPFDEKILLARVKNALDPGKSEVPALPQQCTPDDQSPRTRQKQVYSSARRNRPFSSLS